MTSHANKSRRLAGLAAATATAIILTGCSSGAENVDAADTLTIWTFKNEWVPGLEAAATAFNDATGKDVSVNVEYFGEDDGVYSSKVTAAARGNTLPDLVTAYGSQWDYVGAGIYQQLNGQTDDTLSNFPQPVVEGFITYNEDTKAACAANPDCTYSDVEVGDYYTLPQISGATGFFFANKELLSEAGLDPEKIPADWEELIDAIDTTKSALGDEGGVALPLKIPETGWLWLLRPLLFTQLGGAATKELFDDKTGDAWRDPKVVDALALYDELTPNWIPSVLTDAIQETDQAFASGKATWYYGGTFSLAGLVQKGMDPNNLAIFAMPTAQGGALEPLKLTPWASGSLGVSKDSKNPELALEFLEFYMSPEGAEAFASVVADSPAVTLPEGAQASSPALAAATEATFGEGEDSYSEVDVYGPTCDAASTLNNQAAVALTGLITGQTTPSDLSASLADLYAKAWQACA